MDEAAVMLACAGCLAHGVCVSRGNPEVAVEHLLAVLLDQPMLGVLLDQPTCDSQLILTHHGIDQVRVRTAVNRELDRLRTSSGGRPVFSPLLIDLLSRAWLLASLELGHADIRSGLVLLALLKDPDRFDAGTWAELLSGLPRAEILAKLNGIVAKGSEQTQFLGAGGSAAPAGSESLIAKFCTDFTAKAKEGKLDPVFGRDVEIGQMVDILARRRKKNSICVGEPGVGKTAVVEGLALMIVEGFVPDVLKDVRVVGLDLSLLQAGASVKGEFESRLKGVIDEVKGSPKPVILFIDEAHTLIGAGGQAGMGDAANLLKPALARGELRTIAATYPSGHPALPPDDPPIMPACLLASSRSSYPSDQPPRG